MQDISNMETSQFTNLTGISHHSLLTKPTSKSKIMLASKEMGELLCWQRIAAVRRWMVAGPEKSKLVTNYETASGSKDVKSDICHHQRSPAAQKTFLEKVQKLSHRGNRQSIYWGDRRSSDLWHKAHSRIICGWTCCYTSSERERTVQNVDGWTERWSTFLTVYQKEQHKFLQYGACAKQTIWE